MTQYKSSRIDCKGKKNQYAMCVISLSILVSISPENSSQQVFIEHVLCFMNFSQSVDTAWNVKAQTELKALSISQYYLSFL